MTAPYTPKHTRQGKCRGCLCISIAYSPRFQPCQVRRGFFVLGEVTMLGKLILLLSGVVLGLALSQSPAGASVAALIVTGIHALVG